MEDVTKPLDSIAEKAEETLRDLLYADELRVDQAGLAYRPVPQDGLPVIGAAGPAGLYVTVMHSGITLAAITAEIVAAEIEEGPRNNHLSDLVDLFRPDRFQS